MVQITYFKYDINNIVLCREQQGLRNYNGTKKVYLIIGRSTSIGQMDIFYSFLFSNNQTPRFPDHNNLGQFSWSIFT